MLGHDILTSERTRDIKISEDISFDSMLLSSNTMRGLKSSGFYVPSPIQLHGIPLGKCGFDLLLEAKSGTGKTAVFSVIALEKLNLDKGVQTLVLAPTREIASQICDVIKTIGACFKGLTVEVVMGGLPFQDDVKKFKKNVHVVVGSPGRLRYLIRGQHIDVSSVRLVVLDEADKLFEKDFLPDINNIFSLLPNQRQVIMSSATYPERVKIIMNDYVQNAHHICPDSSSILLGIEQNVILVPFHVNIVKQTKNRYDKLNQILSKKQFKQCLVFCNYQVRVGELHRMLSKDKWPVDKLHGQQEQTDRLEALKILQNYQCRILVTTDLSARGIDASNVDLVINFEIPYDWQTYLHRIGRAGRFGSYGNAITILCEGDEEKKFKKLLGSTNIPFNLKYLWSKEPFLLHSPEKHKIIHEDEVKEINIERKEPERKLGIKETYEELWRMLSVDSYETKKEIHDIPTFESLCGAFEHAINDSKLDEIESFSDLLSSFQNHQVKRNETCEFKTVKVNKLIIPCTIFNRNIIIQSFQKDICLSFTEESKNLNKLCEQVNGSKLVRDEIDLKDLKKACDSQSNKTNHHKKTKNDVIKSKTKEKDDHHETSEDSDREIIFNNNIKNCYKELWKSTNNYNASGSKDHQFKTAPDTTDLPTTSGSFNYDTSSTASKQNREASSIKQFSNNHKKRLIEKVQVLSNAKKSEESYNDSDYNDNSDYQSEYDEDQKSLLAANLPTAFGKSKQLNSMKSNKHNGSFSKIHFSSNTQTRNGEYQAQLCKNRTELKLKTNVEFRDYVNESSDDENEDASVPYRSVASDSSDYNSEYCENQKSLLAANLPTAFEKSKQMNSVKTNKHNGNFSKINFSSKTQTRNGEYQAQLCKNRTKLIPRTDVEVRDYVYESSDNKNEDASVPNQLVLGKKSSKGHRHHNKNRKHVSNNHGANYHFSDYSCSNNATEVKQRQFDLWYQQLHAHMQMIERSVYICEMSSPY